MRKQYNHATKNILNFFPVKPIYYIVEFTFVEIKFECKVFLVLSYFDDIFGPQVMYALPELNNYVLKSVRNLMDMASVHENEFKQFLYADSRFCSQNIKRSVSSQDSRGGSWDFLTSIVVQPAYSHVISAIATDWNTLFELEENILPSVIKYSRTKDLEELEMEVKEAFHNTRENILEDLKFELEILSPGSYNLA